MKIALLCRNPNLYSHRRLIEAANERGHHIFHVDTLQVTMAISAQDPAAYYKDDLLEGFDAIIPRIGASITFYGAAVVRQFEVMGTYSLNGSESIVRARDKLRSMQILARKGLGLPVTAFTHDARRAEKVLSLVGGAPAVIKLVEGTQGIGVVLGETEQSAKSVIEAFRGARVDILVQEYIKESKGSDIRAFVIGNKVVAAMKRQGAKGDFRSNIHRGGSAKPIRISPEERSMAIRAARALGLKVAGVDMLRSNHGPVIMEVNSSPGLEGIEKATGKDIAGMIIDFMVEDKKASKTKQRKGEMD